MEDAIGVVGLMDAWEARVRDKRPRVKTGFSALDDDLHRGGFAPGETVILGGRTHTRKTTVALNMMANMMRAKVRVGFVALDETIAGYTAKLVSIISGLTMEDLEERWDESWVSEKRDEAKALIAGHLAVAKRYRPSFEWLTSWLSVDAPYNLDNQKPQVVFIDYLSLLAREKYAGQEVQRIQRLTEDLQVWTNESEVVTIALHQVGRMDEGSTRRYHGDKPMTLESLKFGGEEVADVVLGTYRPSLDPIGNMSWEEASAQGITEEAWDDAVTRVKTNNDITFLQLLKNRPGVVLNLRGTMLRSPSKSLSMQPAAQDLSSDSDGKVVSFR